MMVELEMGLLDRERKMIREKWKKKCEIIYEMSEELKGKSFGVCKDGRWKVEGGGIRLNWKGLVLL